MTESKIQTIILNHRVEGIHIVSQSIVSVAGYKYFSYRASKVSARRIRMNIVPLVNITWTPARVLRYIRIRTFLPFRAFKIVLFFYLAQL